MIGSRGTFISLALAGFGMATDWRFAGDMPAPAVYRVEFGELADVRILVGAGSAAWSRRPHLSPRTVGYHLHKAFRKPGISARTDLLRMGLAPEPGHVTDAAPGAGG